MSLAYAALWLFVFSVPWANVIIISDVATVSRLTGMLALAVALLAVVSSGRLRRWHLFHIAALLFVAWAGCTQLFFHSGPKLPYKFWTFVQLLLMLWMLWELTPSRRAQLGLLLAFVFGAYVAAVDTILLYRSQAGVLRRFASGGADPNDLAMTLALALPMAWFLGMTYRQALLRWICRAYAPVGLVAIGLTGSRGGMLATTVALLIVPLSMIRLTPGRLATAIVVLGLSGVLAVAYVPETIIQRLASTKSEVEEGRLGGRFTIWSKGMKAFAKKPVTGYGTGAFRQAISRPGQVEGALVAHNSYISVLVEHGLVGFLFYSMMFVAVFLEVLSLPPLERRFALILLATLGIAMLPLTWEDRRPVWFVLAALLGLSQARRAGTGRVARELPPLRTAPIAGPRMAGRGIEPLTAPDRDAMT